MLSLIKTYILAGLSMPLKEVSSPLLKMSMHNLAKNIGSNFVIKYFSFFLFQQDAFSIPIFLEIGPFRFL
jgi:hypothetical protein